MAIIKELTFYDFVKAFENHNRENQFTRAGLSALYDYLEEYSEEIGEHFKLDVIGLCCEFTEYPRVSDALKDYNLSSYDELASSTLIIPTDDGGLLIQNF